MFATILPLLMPILQSVIGGLLADKSKAADLAAQIQIELLNRQAELDKAVAEAAKAQADVNLAEAQSPSLFVAGWRPFIGWVCGLALAYTFLLAPILTWIGGWFGEKPLPMLDIGQLMPLVLGMLGLGAMRTYEKKQGVDRQNIKSPSPSVIKVAK